MNKGFQLDTSLLSPEQLGHVLQIFEARGIPVLNSPELTPITFGKKLIEYEAKSLQYNHNGNGAIGFSTFDSYGDLPIIDYATLCRGAVQLELHNWAKMESIALRENLIMYAANTAEMEYGYDEGVEAYNSRHIVYGTIRPTTKIGIVGTDETRGFLTIMELSPEDFERKLRGIYPVKETEKGEKPRYLKGKVTCDYARGFSQRTTSTNI